MDDASSEAWFPISGSKEVYKLRYAKLASNQVNEFTQG
jgi:hypothetical protein